MIVNITMQPGRQGFDQAKDKTKKMPKNPKRRPTYLNKISSLSPPNPFFPCDVWSSRKREADPKKGAAEMEGQKKNAFMFIMFM